MKRIFVLSFLLVASIDAGDLKNRFGFIIKDPFIEVQFTYTRKNPARIERQIAEDIFAGDFEWTAPLELLASRGPLQLTKVDAFIMEALNKEGYKPGTYVLKNGDLEMLKNGSAHFVIKENSQAKTLEIRLQSKISEREKKEGKEHDS